MRHELTALDRAIFLARRKVTYDLLHPEAAKRGRRKGIGLKFSPIKSFAEDVAERLKISGKAVDLAVRRFNKLSPNVRDRLSGTRIAAKGVWLDQIARLQHDRQIAVVEEMLRQGGAETPALAIQRLFPKLPRPPAAQLPRLTRAWELANAEEREAFVLWLRKNGGLPSRGKGA
jgi:ParB family chromosome partitioning protein